MKKLAVFDWNGTLFDDLSANLAGANAVISRFGKPPLSEAAYQESFTFPILHFYVNNGISTDAYLARHEEVALVFLETYEREAEKCALRQGAEHLLSRLNEQGVHCLLLSNHLRINVEHQLERLGIRDYFQGVSCNEQYDAAFIQKMNKRQRLGEYIARQGLEGCAGFVLGDSLEEPEIARHFGFIAVGITGGCLSEARLRAGQTDLVIGNLQELLDFLSARWEMELC